MDKNSIEKLYKLLEEMPITTSNRTQINEIKKALKNKDFENAMSMLKNLKYELTEENENTIAPIREEPSEEEENNITYPKQLIDEELEETYISLLLNDPKSISRYYFLFEDCFFDNEIILNLYKLVLFADGEKFAPEVAKRNFNFARDIEEIYPLKAVYKQKTAGKKYDFEKIYVELRKLFILRKSYLGIPIKNIQDKIVDIINYKLYNQMSIEEVESAVNQAEVTSKFKQAVLTENVTDFLTAEGNNLANRIRIAFSYII